MIGWERLSFTDPPSGGVRLTPPERGAEWPSLAGLFARLGTWWARATRDGNGEKWR